MSKTQLVNRIAKSLDQYGLDEWYAVLLSTSLQKTGDVDKAVKIANELCGSKSKLISSNLLTSHWAPIFIQNCLDPVHPGLCKGSTVETHANETLSSYNDARSKADKAKEILYAYEDSDTLDESIYSKLKNDLTLAKLDRDSTKGASLLASGLSNSDILGNTRESYLRAVKTVTDSISKESLAIVGIRLSSITFYNNSTDALKGIADSLSKMGYKDESDKYKKEAYSDDNTTGGVYINGEVHIDGNKEESKSEETWSRYGPGQLQHTGVLAHELGHLIDIDGGHSNTNEWNEVFNNEIDKQVRIKGSPNKRDALTTYARTSPFEAFAEFHRLVHGTNVSDKDIENQFQGATKYFKSNRLWRKTIITSNLISNEVYISKRIVW